MKPIRFSHTLQTHLFEDRVMKMSYLRIGPQCSVGSFSVVLYDSEWARVRTRKPFSPDERGISPRKHSLAGIAGQTRKMIPPKYRSLSIRSM